MAQVTDIKDLNPVVASEMKGCQILAEAESKQLGDRLSGRGVAE